MLKAYKRLPSGDRQRDAIPCERFLLFEDEGGILEERLYEEVKSSVSSVEGGLMRLETVFLRSHTLTTLKEIRNISKHAEHREVDVYNAPVCGSS